MNIDWGAFVVVFVVALAASVIVVGAFAIGTRLLAVGAPAPVASSHGEPRDADGTVQAEAHAAFTRPPLATAGAWVCYAIGIAAVLCGIWLTIPQLH